jgi:uncharacterized SAM-binding protein YcdF (DUF218 family)
VPARRPRHRYKPIKLGKRRWVFRLVAGVALLVLLLAAWAALARRFAGAANTSRDHFDAIIVLGSPADSDGNPTPVQLARVTEGVHEYERGVAPRIIFTGGATRHGFVEADVMARTAAAQGIPPSAIFVESRAQDTIQNACYSARIMQAHGWRAAEIISGADHLPRAGLIFSHTALEWRLHAAPPLQPRDVDAAMQPALEVLKTMRYLVYTSWAERCEP